MAKRNEDKKAGSSRKKEDAHLRRQGSRAVGGYSGKEPTKTSAIKEAALKYGPTTEEMPVLQPRSFKVTRADKQKEYSIRTGYGYFIPSFQKAANMVEVAELVEKGISSEEIGPITGYLGFKVSEIAKATAVSASTVSRWDPETSIGVPGSNQFFRIDQVIRKGVDLFGSLEELKGWLQSPNLALGNAVPAKLITSMIGVELVDEALDALHYGNVM